MGERERSYLEGVRRVSLEEADHLEDRQTNLTLAEKLGEEVVTAVLTRPRRLAVSGGEAEAAFLAELNCGLSQCTFISCTIGPLAKKQFTLFKIKSRLWVRSLLEIPRTDIEISSKLVTRVTKLPYGVNPAYLGHRTHLVTTQVTLITSRSWKYMSGRFNLI